MTSFAVEQGHDAGGLHHKCLHCFDSKGNVSAQCCVGRHVVLRATLQEVEIPTHVGCVVVCCVVFVAFHTLQCIVVLFLHSRSPAILVEGDLDEQGFGRAKLKRLRSRLGCEFLILIGWFVVCILHVFVCKV